MFQERFDPYFLHGNNGIAEITQSKDIFDKTLTVNLNILLKDRTDKVSIVQCESIKDALFEKWFREYLQKYHLAIVTNWNTDIGNDPFLENFDRLENIEKILNDTVQEEGMFTILRTKQGCDLNRSCVILCKDEFLQTEIVHLLQPFIPVFLNWMFKEKPLTDEERDLCIAMSEPNSAHWLSCIRKSGIEQYFNAIYVDQHKDFGLQQAIGALKSQIQTLYAQIRELESKHVQYSKQIDELSTEMRGVAFNNASELTDYFKGRNDLHVWDISENTISFIVTGFLDIFDTDTWKHFADNRGFWTNITRDADDIPKAKRVFNKVFVDKPELRIAIKAGYTIGGTDSKTVTIFHPDDQFAGIENPHYMLHSCLGANHGFIRDALQRRGVVSGIEQCVAASKCVNLGETGVTFNPFIKKLITENQKVFSFVSGDDIERDRLYSFSEANEILLKREENAKQNDTATVEAQ